MRIRIKPQFMAGLFLVFASVFIIIANVQKPRILVLHSYHPDYAWVREVSVGIKRILDKYPHYSIRWHYMDTKRHNDKRFMHIAAKAADSLIRRWTPNVIIAVDDNAQKLVASKYVNDSKINIVYTGVNGKQSDYGYEDAKNVTGILERIPLTALKDSLKDILPANYLRIAHVTDSSTTSAFVHKELAAYDWKPFRLTYMASAKTFDDWKNAIREAGKKADIILFAQYHTVQRSATEKEKVPPREIIQWTMKHSRIPGIGCWGFYVEDGGMLSIGVSPYEQGKVAAEMAVQIIQGGKPANIRFEVTRQFIIYARANELKRMHISLPRIHEAFARATDNYHE